MARDLRIVQKLTHAVQQEFGPDVELHFADGLHDYIYMLIIDSSFEDLREYQRQDRIWDVMRKHLEDAELVKVSLTLAFSPREPEARHALEDFKLAS
jgi:acid stress-induced BolA-like protein IbaG/YrbA